MSRKAEEIWRRYSRRPRGSSPVLHRASCYIKHTCCLFLTLFSHLFSFLFLLPSSFFLSLSLSLSLFLPLFHPSWASSKIISIILLFDHSLDSIVNVILLTFWYARTIGKLTRTGIIVEPEGSMRRRRKKTHDNGQRHHERLFKEHLR